MALQIKPKLIEAGLRIHKEIHELDKVQNRMREVGTAHLTEIMNDYDLLPVMNFQYGSHSDAYKLHSDVFMKDFTQGMPDGCWYGCSMHCESSR